MPSDAPPAGRVEVEIAVAVCDYGGARTVGVSEFGMADAESGLPDDATHRCIVRVSVPPVPAVPVVDGVAS